MPAIVTPVPAPLALDSWGWVFILLAAPGLLVLVAVVVAFVVRSKPTGDGPGYYHILGLDKTTGGRREITIRADSRESARGRAALDGIVVTDVRQVDESA